VNLGGWLVLEKWITPRLFAGVAAEPDSQNGHDGTGLCGVCKWHQNPEHVDVALDILEQLTRRYRDHPNLWGIEVLNEPISARMWDLVDVPTRYPGADPEYASGSE
jgi:glucan 1,3-beta-glucosidase